MNPYRRAECPNVDVPAPWRRKDPFPWHKAICYPIVAATFGPLFVLHTPDMGLLPIGDVAHLPLLVIGFVAWIIGVQAPASDTAKARMCRILWNCGQRDTAIGVSIGWIPLRMSKQRMDRNARAVERFVRQRRRERYPWMKH